MPRQPHKIEDLVHQLYADEDVCAAVLADIEANKTADRIVAGELTLPTEVDAKHWHDRLLGRDKMSPEHRADLDKLHALEERITTLEGGKKGHK